MARTASEFLNNVKTVYVMGGSILGKGNISRTSEFNFWWDPEADTSLCSASHIVFSTTSRPIIVLPWETTLEHSFRWTVKDRLSAQTDNVLSRFLGAITAQNERSARKRERPEEEREGGRGALEVVVQEVQEVQRAGLRTYLSIRPEIWGWVGSLTCVGGLTPNARIVVGMDDAVVQRILGAVFGVSE
ncbi:hypothetical protein M427DRAFT_32132 [Gonapodya prolifera JEL478]|uniref:Inosine/uridine-preferring nucleoside hydrolase domain-containing protein n=1 Tax=Gonapodya prolifera (strain JEL478) TaxID=1344416 RepID=A0A139AG89_GONPJ|nr:hypothetical protein M427DRAFT_32132 [Gonapodya prolifera JEL478]|eukprot:KXS15709.1 hypothetical protein M427DRAFT_32132 [Gonapodya prolifera JEL478]